VSADGDDPGILLDGRMAQHTLEAIGGSLSVSHAGGMNMADDLDFARRARHDVDVARSSANTQQDWSADVQGAIEGSNGTRRRRNEQNRNDECGQGGNQTWLPSAHRGVPCRKDKA
jgi:hypothetical protein